MPTVEELQLAGDRNEEEAHHTTKIKWNEKEYPILQKHTINTLAERVLHGLKVNQYQSMLVCGKSGTGKTSFVQNFLHNMVCKRSNNPKQQPFQIQWHHRSDIHNLDKIIANIQQGVPTVLIMDDVSYELEELPVKERRKIFKSMTTIRHQVKSQIFVIFITHYSRSMQKYIRSDSDFTVLLSLSTSELDNWVDIWGKNSSWKLKTFQRQWAYSQREGKFLINTEFRDSALYYKTNEPFRISLVNELGVDIHPTLFVNEFCNHCAFHKQKKQKIDSNELWRQMEFAYKNKAKDCLQWYAYFVHGVKDALPDPKRRAFQYMMRLLSEYDVDMEKLLDIATKSKKYGHHPKHYKKQYEKMTKAIMDKTNATEGEAKAQIGFNSLFP
tara:strand:+ start:870 stop:2021 length:1152 start_codon:yes stop_codon:yes gene_type:complete